MNAIVAQVVRRGDCFCNRSSLPRTAVAGVSPAPFDPLQSLIDAAHAQGIQVHAWIITTGIWQGPSVPTDPTHAFNQHGPSTTGAANWIDYRSDGASNLTDEYFIDPGNPDAAAYIVNMATSIARNYNVDGINLDRIRYPDGNFGTNVPSWGYNPTALARFQAPPAARPSVEHGRRCGRSGAAIRSRTSCARSTSRPTPSGRPSGSAPTRSPTAPDRRARRVGEHPHLRGGAPGLGRLAARGHPRPQHRDELQARRRCDAAHVVRAVVRLHEGLPVPAAERDRLGDVPERSPSRRSARSARPSRPAPPARRRPGGTGTRTARPTRLRTPGRGRARPRAPSSSTRSRSRIAMIRSHRRSSRRRSQRRRCRGRTSHRVGSCAGSRPT